MSSLPEATMKSMGSCGSMSVVMCEIPVPASLYRWIVFGAMVDTHAYSMSPMELVCTPTGVPIVIGKVMGMPVGAPPA